jgi:DNA-binding MarR family transcriptional regulator
MERITLLEKLGFSHGKAAVIMAFEDQDVLSPSEIATATGLENSTVWNAIWSLEKEGIVSYNSRSDRVFSWSSRRKLADIVADLETREKKNMENNNKKIEKLREYSRSL